MRIDNHYRRKTRRRFEVVIAALAWLCCTTPSFAEDENVRTIVFGSMDAGTSVFVGSGFKMAADRVDREGFAMLSVVGAGARTERAQVSASSPLPTLVRTTGLGALLGGYQFFFEGGVLGLFGGPEATFESLLGTGGFGPVETRFGARLHAELWATPSEELLTTVTLVMGSARWDAYARVSAGYHVFGAYVGPEAAAYADRTGYARGSIGLHATDFGFGSVRFRVSGGVSYEGQTGRLGPYLALAAWMPL